jgi:hypothetical protein
MEEFKYMYRKLIVKYWWQYIVSIAVYLRVEKSIFVWLEDEF